MTNKKELSLEELEEVTGGLGFNNASAHVLSGEISTSQAYQMVGQNFFLKSGKGEGRIYATLNSCYEDNVLWWSFTHYRMTIISMNIYAANNYSIGQDIDVNSRYYSLYTNCTGFDY